MPCLPRARHCPKRFLSVSQKEPCFPFPLTALLPTVLGSGADPTTWISPLLTCHNQLHCITGLRPDSKVIIAAAIISSITNAH